MATIVEPSGLPHDSEAPEISARRGVRTRFYLWAALVCAAVAILGFAPTYWLQLPARTFNGPPLLHIHGALATAWVLFLISQSSLTLRGRIARHRDWGLFGIALASVLTTVAIVIAIDAMEAKVERGFGDAARAFLIVPLSAIGLFAGFTAAAVANVRRPEWHRRFMIVGTLGLVEAAMARFFFVMGAGAGPGMRPGVLPPPPASIATVPGLLLELVIVAGMIHDWRTRGRVHPAWIYGLAIMTALIFIRVPLSTTQGWIATAQALGGIAG